MREFLDALRRRSPRRSRRSPPFAVELEFPAEIAGVRDGLLPRVVPLLLADHRHLASGGRRAGGLHRATGCRSGCSSSGAIAASARCCGSRARSRGDRARRAAAGALRCPGRRSPPTRGAPGGVRRRRAAPVLAGRRRSRRRGGAARAWSRPTCASSAAASPGCGRRCTPRRDDPARDVVLLEAETAGFGASGRNGGFCVASLTHGIENGLARFARRWRCSSGSGWRTSPGCAPTWTRYGIDCDFEPTGELLALTDAYQQPWLEEERESLRALRPRGRRSSTARRCAPRSTRPPTSAASGTTPAPASSTRASSRAGCATAALRRRACASSSTPRVARPADAAGPVVEALTASGRVRARKVLLATSAYPPLLRSIAPLRRAGLRLRAGDRAAERRAAATRSAGSTARASATAATSSTTTA